MCNIDIEGVVDDPAADVAGPAVVLVGWEEIDDAPAEDVAGPAVVLVG